MSRMSTSLKLSRGLCAASLALGLLAQPAGAVDAPRLDPAALAAAAVGAAEEGGSCVVLIRAGRSGGGGGFRGGGGRGHRGGGFAGPLLFGSAIGYGAYSGYGYGYGYGYDDDCRTVRVRSHQCWRDSDGDRHCGNRLVYSRVCY